MSLQKSQAWKLLDLVQEASSFFRSRQMENPRLQAELLLAAALEITRLDLYLQFDKILQPEETERFRGYVRQRLAGRPAQHITGEVGFRLLDFEVSPDVLIPRPETEILVEAALEYLRDCDAGLVLELGCGSGAIAICLAHEEPSCRVVADDISALALAVARRNVEQHGVSDRVQLLRGDLLAPLASSTRFDAVVSNPPYIPSAQIYGLDPEVRDHEPHAALDGGADGLDYYRMLAAGTVAHLQPGGALFLEVGHDQADEVCGLLQDAGGFRDIATRPDLAGVPRVVSALKAA